MSISSVNFNETKNHSTREAEKSNYLTTAKIKQIALYSFALLLALAIVGAYFFAPPSYSLLPTPLSFGILGLAYSANQIKDFKNPQKMKMYKKQAEAMPLPKIHKYFGLKTALENNLFAVEELQNKFNKEIQELDFCTVANNYPLDELLQLKIAPSEHIELLKNLKAEENQARNILNKSIKGSASRIKFNYAVHSLEKQYSTYKLTRKDV